MSPVITFMLLIGLAPAVGAEDAPWWKRQKMRLMWGQWNHARIDLSHDYWHADLPHSVFVNVARAGGTVFVESLGYKPDHARFAQEQGMKYFACRYVITLQRMEGRRWVRADGNHHWTCPLDRGAYEHWIENTTPGESILDGIRAGLVDGILFDWEAYGGNGEAGFCYCDHCMTKFPGFADTGADLPAPDQRDEWIAERKLTNAFTAHFSKRRVEMFTAIRRKLHAIKPDLLFGHYAAMVNDFSRGMHTREAPFIIADAHHYLNEQTQPWWKSYAPWLRKHGYLYIPGGWVQALFGAQANEVDAAQFIYESSIGEDGCWLWFERELDDEILGAYAAADRRIQGVVHAVGDFLMQGRRDHTFVTAVEWTGRPSLQRSVLAPAYHLGDEHVAHVSNVDTLRPLRVRVRLAKMKGPGPWVVRDALSGLVYTHGTDSRIWTAQDLAAGVGVALRPRSDVFLRLSPADAAPQAAPRIRSATFDTLPDHATAAAAAGPVREMVKLYVMNNAIVADDLTALEEATEKVMTLPEEGWHFRMDRSDAGAAAGWFNPDTPLDDWKPIRIGAFWGELGGHGAGWYRFDLDVPSSVEGKQVYLRFGAVDELMVLWIDGRYAGDHDRGLHGWDQPFAIDVTGRLTPGRHHLAMRVHNEIGAGGVWKPVSLHVGYKQPPAVTTPETEPDSSARPPRPLLYTATERVGRRGAEGGLSIANAIRTLETGAKRQMRLRQLRGNLWSPRYAPDAGRIAFVHNAGGRGQIWVMNGDGSDAHNLSDSASCDRDPRWSPDGKRIAFASDRTGDWDIWVMDDDGSDQERIAGNPGLDLAHAWAPDGTRIAWESHVSGMPDVWICRADGSDAGPAVDPKGDIEMVSWDPGAGVIPAPDLQTDAFYMTRPVWSPDSTRLAGTGLWWHRMVYILHADGSRIVLAHPELQGAANVCWSPNGRRLAGSFSTEPQETEHSGIFVIDCNDGSHRFLVKVVPTPSRLGGARRHGLHTWYTHGSALPTRLVRTFTNVSFSPDGETLVFSSDMDASGAFHLYTVDVDGGEPVRLDATLSAWRQEVMWKP